MSFLEVASIAKKGETRMKTKTEEKEDWRKFVDYWSQDFPISPAFCKEENQK